MDELGFNEETDVSTLLSSDSVNRVYRFDNLKSNFLFWFYQTMDNLISVFTLHDIIKLSTQHRWTHWMSNWITYPWLIFVITALDNGVASSYVLSIWIRSNATDFNVACKSFQQHIHLSVIIKINMVYDDGRELI